MKPPKVIEAAAIEVAPELVGRELASPARRLAAMLIDLTCVSVIALLGFGALAGVAAFATWRAASRQASLLRRRAGRAAAVALVALGVVLAIANMSDGSDIVKVKVDGEEVGLSGAELLAVAPEAIALEDVTTDAEADRLARLIVSKLEKASDNPATARALMRELSAQLDNPRAAAAMSRALATKDAPPDAALVRRYADALAAGDAGSADALRRDVAEQVAAPELLAARQSGQHEHEENRALAAELAEAKKPLLRRSLGSIADSMGLRIGWSALYFTAVTAALKGQTLGKRLMRTRVVRLDGKPLTWWIAFNRYGGYAASAFLGMTGFLTVFNDRHRQGLHDKIAWTVVVRETRPSAEPDEGMLAGTLPQG